MGILAIYLGILAAILTAGAGWVNNVLWTFQQDTVVDLALGIVGIFVPFIGAIHGMWLWL